jgi:hypothetical protein
MTIEHTVTALDTTLDTTSRSARPPWLPPRPARDRQAASPLAAPRPATARPAAPAQPVRVAVEVTVTGQGAVTLGAEIADQFRSLAAALAIQASAHADVSVTAAIALGGDRAATPAPVAANGRLRVYPEQRLAMLAGAPLDLTRREFDLLVYLARQPGRVFTRTQLLQSVWGHTFVSGERTVDVHVRRIRGKLGDAEGLIGTVRGVGYRFGQPGSTAVVEDPR